MSSSTDLWIERIEPPPRRSFRFLKRIKKRINLTNQHYEDISHKSPYHNDLHELIFNHYLPPKMIKFFILKIAGFNQEYYRDRIELAHPTHSITFPNETKTVLMDSPPVKPPRREKYTKDTVHSSTSGSTIECD